jgi:glyoxylase-like metal-dependent hydrolase (beta-lactamase superfamily II)
MQTIAPGLTYTDLKFQGHARVIATAVVQNPEGVALVDPGPSTSLDTLRGALAEHGITAADLRWLLLTHIHLDHAGVVGLLVRENPEITVYVHERGAPHMVEPSKLLASATRLYGDDMDRLWGEFLPVPRANVHALSGGELVEAAGRVFEVASIPGHASHHVGYLDRSSGVAFVGDTAGIRTGRDLFAMPPTPPPDIDVETWIQSVELIRRWEPSTLFVTHFGPHEDPQEHLDVFLEHLSVMTEMVRKNLDGERKEDDRIRAFVDKMRVYLQRHLPAAEAALYDHAAPLTQCWLGLARYWRKRGVGTGGLR